MDRGATTQFELKEFPTHIAYSNSKKNPKFVKINYQNIYNGRIAHFSRAIMVNNLHDYIGGEIGEGEPIGENLLETITIYTVINHDSITRRKVDGEYMIKWKPPKEG